SIGKPAPSCWPLPAASLLRPVPLRRRSWHSATVRCEGTSPRVKCGRPCWKACCTRGVRGFTSSTPALTGKSRRRSWRAATAPFRRAPGTSGSSTPWHRVEVAGHGAAGQAALERRTLQEGRSRVGGNAEVAASLANALDEFEPLTQQHHARSISSKPLEISRVGLPPVLQRAVTFTLVIGKRLIDFLEAPLRQFDGLDDGFRDALPVQDDHHLADLRRKQAMAFRPAGRTLGSRQNQFEKFIGQLGTIAERKRLQVSPFHTRQIEVRFCHCQR